MATGGAALAPVLSSQSSQREAGMGCAGGVTLMSPGHQGYTPGHLCPPQQPSTGHRAPSGPGAVLGSHFPLSWASWALPADVPGAIPAFHKTESRRQPDISTLLLAARDPALSDLTPMG